MKTLNQTLILANRLGQRSLTQRVNRLLSICIIVCSGVAAALSFFSQSVQTALDDDIANYLGAPLVVRAAQALNSSAFDVNGISPPVFTAAFTTGAISGDAYQSVSLKGVSSAYPLQGELVIRDERGERLVSAKELKLNQAWLDSLALDQLKIELGDTVQVGRQTLVVAAEVVFEPDRLTQLQHALPRVMVSTDSLANTGVADDNERGEYRALLSGEKRALEYLEAQLPALLDHEFDVFKPGKGRHPFSRMSLRAERLLNVVLVLILLMCGGAAATLADHSVRNYAMPASMLRCMGVNRRVVSWALCLQLLLIALISSLVGCLIGWLLQPLLINVMQPHMSLQVARVELRDLVGPIGIGVVTVLTFVVPKLQKLSSMSVVSVLRGVVEGVKGKYITGLCAAVVVAAMLWMSSDNAQLTLMLVGAVSLLVVLATIFGWGLSKLSAQAHHLFRGPMKVAVRSIGRSSGRHIAPLTAVSIAMMAVLMTLTLRGSFLDALQVQMLETDGNYIFSGLPSDERTAFVDSVSGNAIELKGIFPTVTAKLVAINGVDIESALDKESDTREETRSSVRLSWSEEPPQNNRMLDGAWPSLGSNAVSVESEVMTDFGLVMGDKLRFQIGDRQLESTITSRREYKGGGSRMMFWFMFSPDALSQFEHRYMGGLMMRGDAQEALSNLAKAFPQVRVINLERQIAGIRNIMIVLTRLMNTTLLLLLAGAVMVIIATSFVSAAHKQTQMTLLRAFGLRRNQYYAMAMIEHITVGLVACLVGILGVQIIAELMFQNLFALSYKPDWFRSVLLTLCISAAFAILGWVFAYRNLRSPAKLA